MKNAIKIMLLATVSTISGLGFASQAEEPRTKSPATHQLDVARVISIQPERSHHCSVQANRMVYEDSKGQRHEVQYKVMGTGCGG